MASDFGDGHAIILQGIKKIEGEDELYRLLVGDYRILYQFKPKVLLVLIIGVGHRREVYRRIRG